MLYDYTERKVKELNKQTAIAVAFNPKTVTVVQHSWHDHIIILHTWNL